MHGLEMSLQGRPLDPPPLHMIVRACVYVSTRVSVLLSHVSEQVSGPCGVGGVPLPHVAMRWKCRYVP